MDAIHSISGTIGQPARLWTPAWRAAVFALSATSIWCLMAEFYKLCSMGTFTFWVLPPPPVVPIPLPVHAPFRGDQRLWRAVVIGVVAGFAAAVSYDIFRIPFVVA